MLVKYKIILLFLVCCIHSFAYGQVPGCKLLIIADTVNYAAFKHTAVNIFQNNRIIKGKLFEYIRIQKGIAFDIEFDNNNTQIPGYKRLLVFTDTTMVLSARSLTAVIVKAKKKVVLESLKGFEYYPQNDSIYRDKSILISLQRLPFISLANEYETPKYREDNKILFLINGKERKGIGDRWVDVLRSIKAKDIYKVELIEDIPALVRNQGYGAIINIFTLDENIYGTSFDAALVIDQRDNLNKNIGATFLRKKTDLSINVSSSGDKLSGFTETTVKDNNHIAATSFSSTRSISKYQALSLSYGYRLDSVKDVGISITSRRYSDNTRYNNEYSFPKPVYNLQNGFKKNTNSLNMSYINRKKKSSQKSYSLSFNPLNDFLSNRLGYLATHVSDSIVNIIKNFQFSTIAEYNVQNTSAKKVDQEFGVQVYLQKVKQNFEAYGIDSISNKVGSLLYEQNNSLLNYQFSVRPYFLLGKNISKKKRLTLTTVFEYYNPDLSRDRDGFILPQVKAAFKNILNSKYSIRYLFNLSFEKPNIDYLSPILVQIDPNQQNVGSLKLIPSKVTSATFELVRRNKSTITNSVYVSYAYDKINFFRNYDLSTGKIISQANNGAISKSIANYFGYRTQLNKKMSLSFNFNVWYKVGSNKQFKTKFSGFTFTGGHNLQYDIAPKYGTLGFISFLNSNQNGTQGYYQGTIKYSLWYSKSFFKRKLGMSLSADNFLLKNRNILTYTFNDNYRTYTRVEAPFRLISLRIAYHFSDIKNGKYAAKKITEISGEVQRVN